jgi:predicted Zn-dependent peptidase
MRGGLVLGLEDTGSRMSRLGKAELVYGEIMTVEEVLGHIDDVTLDATQAVAADLLEHPDALAVVGPYDENTREFAA